MCEQEHTGIRFDENKAKGLVQYIDSEMEKIRSEVEPKLPKRLLNKTEEKLYTPPKIQFKKNGEPSAACLKWFDDVFEGGPNGQDYFFGTKGDITIELPYHEPIIKELPMTLSNQQQIKNWLLDIGWKPTLWNLKKDQRGKPVRDDRGNVIKTTPKFHEQGRICPNLEKLGNKVELVKPIITWLSLRNRRSVLLNEEKETGWLNHPRLKIGWG